MNRVCLLLRPWGLSSILLACVLISGCSAPDPPPAFEIVTEKESDQVTFEFAVNELRFDVNSETGTGGGEIKLISGQWPEIILVRVHTSGLESFKFSYPDTVIEVSVSSTGDRNVHRSVMQIGKDIESAGKDTEFFMAVEKGEQKSWVQVQLPADFHERKPDRFRIDWIEVLLWCARGAL